MEKVDLTTGRISKKLLKITIPVILGSIMQIAYNLTDMFFLGQVGSGVVAAAGTAGFYFWICITLGFLAKVGTEIKVAQSSGEHDQEKVTKYAKSGIQIAVVIGILFFIFAQVLKLPLINFFNLTDQTVVKDAITYLNVISFGFLIVPPSMVFSGIMNGTGNTKKAFQINSIGLIANIILDPILIFGLNMGIFGAALASMVTEYLVFIVFIIYLRKKSDILKKAHLFEINKPMIKELLKLGFPAMIQNVSFAFISMVVARIIGSYGAVAIAVQRLGSQIESIGWMVAVGVRTSIVAFIGQNVGAKKWERLLMGYGITMKIMLVYSVIIATLLYFGATPLMTIFFNGEQEAVQIGTTYLQIMFFVQVFIAIDSINYGALNAFGHTKAPSITSLSSDGMRIILAIILGNNFGLTGVWWALAISESSKGVFTQLLFLIKIKRTKELNFKDIFKKERSLA